MTAPHTVEEALAVVEARCAADPDLVHGDVVEEVAKECPLEVAVALCEQAMAGFVPDTIRQRQLHAEYEDVIAADRTVRAERHAVEQAARQRSQRAAATRAATAAAESAAQSATIRATRCPRCFMVPSASGVCACD